MEEPIAPAWANTLFIIGFLLIMFVVPLVMALRAKNGKPDASPAGDSTRAPQPLFVTTSDRERRLWLTLVAVLAVIYSTMGLAGQLAQLLIERNLLGITSAAFLGAVGVVVLVKWLQTRPGLLELAAGIGLIAVILMATSRTSIPERTHLFEYGLVAILIYQALKERRRNGHWVPVPAVLAVFGTAFLGLVDECIQSLVPGRFFDWDDVLVNSVSAIVTSTASAFLEWVRRLDLRRRWAGSGLRS